MCVSQYTVCTIYTESVHKWGEGGGQYMQFPWKELLCILSKLTKASSYITCLLLQYACLHRMGDHAQASVEHFAGVPLQLINRKQDKFN